MILSKHVKLYYIKPQKISLQTNWNNIKHNTNEIKC